MIRVHRPLGAICVAAFVAASLVTLRSIGVAPPDDLERGLAPVSVHLFRPPDDPWRRATPGYRFQFPRDHTSHPPFKIEWWYYTGNVSTREGRRFGYQLTFFRVGLVFEPAIASPWSVRDLFMAHLAVTDIDRGRFRFAERLNRAGISFAGAREDRYDVWNEDWRVSLDGQGRHRLSATTDVIGIDLALDEGKAPVIHGERGISQKGAQPGNATHYYSLTRMPTSGTLTIDGESMEIEGRSWMDHEFGTSFLEIDQIGWDWFSLQLDDGTDVMLFQLRRRDGSRDPHSAGTVIGAGGDIGPIRLGDFTLRPRRTWTSAASGASYPVQWRLEIPPHQLDLTATAAVDDQELRTGRTTGVIYWEGAITVSGTLRGHPVTGRGYLEMTGYAGPGLGSVVR